MIGRAFTVAVYVFYGVIVINQVLELWRAR